MQLRYDDTLGAIDDESSIFGHQRHFAHINFLFLDILDRTVFSGSFLVVDDKTNQHA